MKPILSAVLVFVSAIAHGQTPAAGPAISPPTLKSILLQQLKTTHNVQDWFVPAAKALDGLTVEDAPWSDGERHGGAPP